MRRSSSRRPSASPPPNAAIAAVAADPELAAYHADAPRLASMLAFATRPQQRAQELAQALLAAELPATLAVDLHDLVDLERTGKRYTDVGAWIHDIDVLNGDKGRQNAEVKADVLARWRDTRALPWLAAAMMYLEPGDPDAAAAITASQAVDAASPAYYTLAWNRLRLLIGQGKADDARAELDRTLAAPALPAGVGNLMRYQRLMLARDVGEYAKFAVRRGEFLMYVYDPRTGLSAMPLPLTPTKWDSYIAKVVDWRTELFQKDPLYLDSRCRLRHVELHAAADDGAGRAGSRAAAQHQARPRACGVDARGAARRCRHRQDDGRSGRAVLSAACR